MPVPDLLPGAEIAGCRIEAVAGRGGMGIVYRATQLSLGRPVAVKLIAPDRAGDPGFRERFERESRVAAAIDHPNVIPVYAAGEEDGHLYLVMRYVKGTDLQRLLARDRRLCRRPRRRDRDAGRRGARRRARRRAGAPRRQARQRPARRRARLPRRLRALPAGRHRPRLTTTGQWIGTVDFMAPEQFARRRGRRARRHLRARLRALRRADGRACRTRAGPCRRRCSPTCTTTPPRPTAVADDIPAGFDRVIARALAKDPEDRYPSAGDLGRAALAAAEGRHVTEVERIVARGAAAPYQARVNRRCCATRTAPPCSRMTTPSPPCCREERPAERNGHAAGGPPRAHPAPAAPDAPARRQAAPPSRPPRRRRARRVLAAAGVVALAATQIAGGGDGTDPTLQPGAPVSDGEVEELVSGFSDAYAKEDAAALTRLLTRDAERVVPGARQEGRTEVIRSYRRQFADSDTRSFEVQDLAATGGATGRASGRYVATYGGEPDVTGTITFGVLRDRGTPRIAMILAHQDTPARD